jgi:hypothetical protein
VARARTDFSRGLIVDQRRQSTTVRLLVHQEPGRPHREWSVRQMIVIVGIVHQGNVIACNGVGTHRPSLVYGFAEMFDAYSSAYPDIPI